MAKKVVGKIGLQIPAGKATPAPPIGPALGPYSLNIMDFCKQYNERTASQAGMIIPVEITVFEDRTFYVHHEDAAGVVPHQTGAQDRVGQQGAESQQGRQANRRSSWKRSPK